MMNQDKGSILHLIRVPDGPVDHSDSHVRPLPSVHLGAQIDCLKHAMGCQLSAMLFAIQLTAIQVSAPSGLHTGIGSFAGAGRNRRTSSEPMQQCRHQREQRRSRTSA